MAWFAGPDGPGPRWLSLRRDRGGGERGTTARDARDEPTKNAQLEKRPTTFAAPDFVVATNDSFVFALRSGDFNAFGSDEACPRASLVNVGARNPRWRRRAPHRPCALRRRLTRRRLDLELRHTLGGHAGPTRGGVKPQSKPTCVAYRTTCLGVVVGDARRSSRRAARRRWRRRRRCGSRPGRGHARVLQRRPGVLVRGGGGQSRGVSLFRLLGLLSTSRGTAADPARAFDRVGVAPDARPRPTARAWRPPSSPRPPASPSSRVVRWRRGPRREYDVEGSTAEDGVDVLEVSDVALGGESAGGDARPAGRGVCQKKNAAAKKRARGSSRSSPSRDGSPSRASRTSDVGCESGSGSESESDSEEPHEPTLLVADDHLKLRLVDCEDADASGCGAPLTGTRL